MIFFGSGELIGGLFVGKIRDNFGQKCAAIVVLLFTLIQSFVTIFQIINNKFGGITLIMTLIWGIQDSAINVLIYSILGFEFEDRSMPFSTLNLM